MGLLDGLSLPNPLPSMAAATSISPTEPLSAWIAKGLNTAGVQTPLGQQIQRGEQLQGQQPGGQDVVNRLTTAIDPAGSALTSAMTPQINVQDATKQAYAPTPGTGGFKALTAPSAVGSQTVTQVAPNDPQLQAGYSALPPAVQTSPAMASMPLGTNAAATGKAVQVGPQMSTQDAADALGRPFQPYPGQFVMPRRRRARAG